MRRSSRRPHRRRAGAQAALQTRHIAAMYSGNGVARTPPGWRCAQVAFTSRRYVGVLIRAIKRRARTMTMEQPGSSLTGCATLACAARNDLYKTAGFAPLQWARGQQNEGCQFAGAPGGLDGNGPVRAEFHRVLEKTFPAEQQDKQRTSINKRTKHCDRDAAATPEVRCRTNRHVLPTRQDGRARRGTSRTSASFGTRAERRSTRAQR